MAMSKKDKALLPAPVRCGSKSRDGTPCKGWSSPPGSGLCLTHQTSPEMVKKREEGIERSKKPTLTPHVLALAPDEIPSFNYATQKSVDRFLVWLSRIIMEGRIASALAAQVISCVKTSLLAKDLSIAEELLRLEALIVARELKP